MVFFSFIQPDLTQTVDEEIGEDISRLEEKYHEQVVSVCYSSKSSLCLASGFCILSSCQEKSL